MADEKKTYHGKDLVAKILTNTFGNKSFAVYGLNNLPKIKQYLPTELPAISGNDRFADHIFEFEDGTYGIVDYESKYLKANKIKYLEYATRLIRHYFDPDKDVKIRIIVIYTCDVESADNVLDAGAVKLEIEQAFLSHIDGKTEYDKIKAKIIAGDIPDDEELMKLIILPLTVKGNLEKGMMIDNIIELGRKLKDTDEDVASFVLSGMAIAIGNYLSKDQEDSITEVIRMTRIGQSIVDQVTKETETKAKRATAITMIRDGEPVDRIVRYSGMSEDDVRILISEERKEQRKEEYYFV